MRPANSAEYAADWIEPRFSTLYSILSAVARAVPVHSLLPPLSDSRPWAAPQGIRPHAIQHPRHTADFRRLIRRDIRDVGHERVVLVARLAGLHELMDHGDGPSVVHDHVGEEQPVELAPSGPIERRH